jgi:hypothetical protein
MSQLGESAYPSDIIVRGKEYRPDKDKTYTKKSTGAAGEINDIYGGIAGRVDDDNVRLWETGDVPVGVFVVQESHRPYIDDQWSYRHAQDGKVCNIVEGGVFLYRTRITTSQTITQGDALEPKTAVPELQIKSAGPTVARANKSITTTGSPDWTEVWNLINVS